MGGGNGGDGGGGDGNGGDGGGGDGNGGGGYGAVGGDGWHAACLRQTSNIPPAWPLLPRSSCVPKY